MHWYDGFIYAIQIIIKPTLKIMYFAMFLALFEFVTHKEIFIQLLRKPKKAHLIGIGPRLYSLIYFLVCFFYLIDDAYMKKNAPSNFIYLQWAIIVGPIAIGLKCLFDKMDWKGEEKQ